MNLRTLQIDEQTARNNYPKADAVMKQILENSFPAGFFTMSIEEKVPTVEVAYSLFLEMKFVDPDFLILQKRKVDEMTSLEKLMICAEVWREGWEANYDDINQKKWHSWAQKTASGWVFDDTSCEYTLTLTSVGPRFVFPSETIAKKFFQTFFQLFINHLTIKR